MSYIKHKDRVFLNKGRNAVRKRSDCNLRKISSCSDVRAWSLCAEDRRQYFLDNVSSKSSSSFGKYVPPDVIVEILRKQNSNHLKKINCLKRCSSEDLKKKDGFLKKRQKSLINVSKCHEKDTDNTKADLELNNLRLMVKELESKLTGMKVLEDENMKLKSQINNEIKKIENFEAVGPLVPNFLPSNDKSEYLSDAVDVMRDRCRKMQLNVDYLQSKNVKLSNKLKKTSSNERFLKDRQLIVSLESVNNAILKSKVSSKDVKIQRLQAVNNDQKAQIDNLICHINELSLHFSWKEEVLMGKLVEFKNLVKSSHEKAVEYENHISLYQNVIFEMDILRDHFKGLNAALKEEAVYYKNNLRVVALKVLDMAGKIECLLREINKRDARIKELSKFPGRSALAVRLSQLHQILNSDFIFAADKNGVIDTFERLKKVLHELRRDAWDSYAIEGPLSFTDNYSQCLTSDCKECGSQAEYIMSNMKVQTDIPDEFVVKFITYTIFITLFNRVIKRLKLYLKKEKLENRDMKDELEKMACLLNQKNTQVEALNDRNMSLQKSLEALSSKACEERSYAADLLKNSECILELYESLNSLSDCSMSTTVNEYDSYCILLENLVHYYEERLCELTEIIEIELEEERWQHFRYLCELEKKNSLLNETLALEFKINESLLGEIDSLKKDLEDRDDIIYELKDCWMQTECEKAQLMETIMVTNHRLNVSSQVSIDLTDSESMTDLDVLNQPTSCIGQFIDTRSIEIQTQENISCPKNPGKMNAINSNFFWKKMSRVNINVKRIKNRVFNLRNRLELSVEALHKFKESNDHIAKINKNLSEDNLKLKNQISNMQISMSALKTAIKNETSKNNKLQDDQITFFNDFQRIQSELINLKDKANRRMSENSINTEVTMSGFELLLMSKDECIKQLKERIEKLLDLLKDIEAEKKAKENNSICEYSQCDFENEAEEQYKVMQSELKESYENLINNMKKKFSEEKDTKEKYFRNNLSLLKDTYERDIKRIKAANAESLRKIQTFHEDEIRALKQSQEDAKSKNEPIDSNFIQEKHSLEMEQLRINYEKMIKEKSELFLKEKENLQEEMKKYMFDKERQVEEITRKMELGIKNMKKKCKQHMKKIQRENCCALDDLRKQFSINKVDDTSSVDMSDGYSLSQDKEYSLAESDGTLCVKDDCDTFLELKTDTSGFDEDQYDCVVVDERRFLLKRIEQLEDQLAEKEAQSSENACDSEKRVWLERERCRELRKLLDKEVERNEKFKSMLKQEKSRADNLAMLNQALLIKLQSVGLEKQEKSISCCNFLNQDLLSNYDYIELYGNYNSNMISESNRKFGPNNFKAI